MSSSPELSSESSPDCRLARRPRRSRSRSVVVARRRPRRSRRRRSDRRRVSESSESSGRRVVGVVGARRIVVVGDSSGRRRSRSPARRRLRPPLRRAHPALPRPPRRRRPPARWTSSGPSPRAGRLISSPTSSLRSSMLVGLAFGIVGPPLVVLVHVPLVGRGGQLPASSSAAARSASARCSSFARRYSAFIARRSCWSARPRRRSAFSARSFSSQLALELLDAGAPVWSDPRGHATRRLAQAFHLARARRAA